MKGKRNDILAPILILAVTAVIITTIILVILYNGETNNVIITGGSKVVGLKCENNTLVHPVLTDFTPETISNKITANFQNNKLDSITYRYEGIYGSAEEVKDAEAFAAADYNTILAKEYGEDIEIFSHVFFKDGEKLHLTITADSNRVSSKVAPYFLLDNNKTFPKQIDVMKTAYEEKNFSCEIVE